MVSGVKGLLTLLERAAAVSHGKEQHQWATKRAQFKGTGKGQRLLVIQLCWSGCVGGWFAVQCVMCASEWWCCAVLFSKLQVTTKINLLRKIKLFLLFFLQPPNSFHRYRSSAQADTEHHSTNKTQHHTALSYPQHKLPFTYFADN